MKTKAKLFSIMLAAVCSFAADTPTRAQGPKPDSASPSSSNNARLVVNRAANFGILESVNVFIDGVQVAELELSQSYEAVLAPGQHLLSISMNPKTEGQRPTQRREAWKGLRIYRCLEKRRLRVA